MKHTHHPTEINLIGSSEQALRLAPVRRAMEAAGIRRALVRNLTNIFWLTGRVFRGFVYIDLDLDAPRYFVRQPNHLTGSGVYYIRKPEDIPVYLAGEGIATGAPVALELDSTSYAESVRLARCFGMEMPAGDVSAIIRDARSVKTPAEIELLKESGTKQSLVYERIPHLYREGMTDIEFQIEIERALRLEGCLGQFRMAGDLELFMGNVLTGENADTPSPYDFAMGGAGISPSIPVGADGSMIRPGMPVMVDMNGNFNGYMTDMTRCYCAGTPDPRAVRANELSIAICDELATMMVPGAKAADLYNRAVEMARAAGMEEYFMGHRSHAGFVGHGVAIDVNEAPVLAPRSRDVLRQGNVIALEPKFVVPGLGAIGVENTYVVTGESPATALTTAPMHIIKLD